MDDNNHTRRFAGISGLASTADDKNPSTKASNPQPYELGPTQPPLPRDGLGEKWLFVCKDGDDASIYIYLPSIPPEESEIIVLNISIVPNKKSDTYRQALQFLRSKDCTSSLHRMEQRWKIIIRSSLGKSKHFAILESVFKDENDQTIYSDTYKDLEWKPILSDYISKPIYHKIIDIWAYGKDKCKNPPQGDQPEPSEIQKAAPKKLGFSGLSDLVSDLDQIDETVNQGSSAHPTSSSQTMSESARTNHNNQTADRQEATISDPREVSRNIAVDNSGKADPTKKSTRFIVLAFLCIGMLLTIIGLSKQDNDTNTATLPPSPPIAQNNEQQQRKAEADPPVPRHIRSAPSQPIPRPSTPRRAGKKISLNPSSSQQKQTDDFVTVGQFMCSRHLSSTILSLKPDSSGRQSIATNKARLDSETAALKRLKNSIDINFIDRSSQDSVDYHNMQVNDFNSRLRAYKLDVENLKHEIDRYNAQVNAYNSFLEANCSRRY